MDFVTDKETKKKKKKKKRMQLAKVGLVDG
jgi:hypothetical protein